MRLAQKVAIDRTMLLLPMRVLGGRQEYSKPAYVDDEIDPDWFHAPPEEAAMWGPLV